MTREQVVLILGVWVAILPFLGIPLDWKRILFLISGVLIAFLGYTLHKRAHTKTPTSYVENNGEPFRKRQERFSVNLELRRDNEEE